MIMEKLGLREINKNWDSFKVRPSNSSAMLFPTYQPALRHEQVELPQPATQQSYVGTGCVLST